MSAVNPFTPTQELRFARVAARVTRKLSRGDLRHEVFAVAYIRARETYGDFDETRGEGAIESRLDNWFYGIVLNARKKIMRNEIPLGNAEALDELVSGDNPEADVSRDEALEGLDADDTVILEALRDGASVRQAARAHGVNVNKVKKLKRRLRTMLQVEGRVSPATRRAPARNPDNLVDEQTPIDRDLERADNVVRPRAHGSSDCPPCLACSWWEGFKAGAEPHAVVEPDIAAAIAQTHARKQEISTGWERAQVPHCSRDAHRIEHETSQEQAT